MGASVANDDDFKLLDQYQSFSAEVVRVSLLAIGAVGALYTLKGAEVPQGISNTLIKVSFIIGIIAFGLAIAFALLHRYWATDFMACNVKLKRLTTEPSTEKTLAQNEAMIIKEKEDRSTAACWSRLTIWGGPFFMAIGAVFMVIGFGGIICLR